MIRINSVLDVFEYIIENSGETEFIISEDVLGVFNNTFEEGTGLDFDVQISKPKGVVIKFLGATFYEKEEDAIKSLVK